LRKFLGRFLMASLLAVAHAADAQTTLDQLRIVAPAAPGGGWDQTARVMQQVLQRSGRVRVVPVENIPGAAGTIGLARFIGAERGNGDALMVSGLIMLAAIVTHHSPLTLDDVTPIARLTGEYEVIAVPANSPFRSLSDLIEAFKKRPEAISWSGGSAGGGDQILAGLVAVAVGVPAARVNYVAFSGGGESLAALVGGQVNVGVSGLAEFAPHIDAGTIRALAISSANRLPGLDLPTLREQGVDVEFENWRSLVAPPGISKSDRDRLEALVADMVRSREWHDALTRYRWLDRHLAGRPFTEFVSAEKTRVERILRDFGRSSAGAGSAYARTYPLFVLAGLVLTAIAAVVQGRRAANGAVAAREWAGWRPVALLTAGIVLNLILAEWTGFVLASAVLFWCTARAFDPSRPFRDAMLAVVMAIGAYVLFARVLQLPLPLGPLARLL
jgi:putative tricarboxylic transport membrane protein